MDAPAIRYHYMDNLRALAMLTGIFFHAAVAYSPFMTNLWLTADPRTSVSLDYFAWFSHMFRMPLFFLIAGFFTCYMIQKRGYAGFLKNRALRIALPFVIFLPLVAIAILSSVTWAIGNVENPSPLLKSIASMVGNPNAPQSPPSTTHLWFLYNLVQFYLLYVLLDRFGVLNERLTGVLTSPRVLVFLVPLLLAPALATQPTPHPAPEQFEPKLWSFGFYGIFFLIGSRVYLRQQVIDQLKPYAWWLLATSIVAYTFLHTTMLESPSLADMMALMGKRLPFSWTEVGHSVLEAYIAVHMTIVCLVAGKALLDRASNIVRYIADSSYWVYIIHLPVLFQIQFWLLDVEANLWIKFAISSFGTLAIGILTYAALIRWSPIGWMLNGRRDGGS